MNGDFSHLRRNVKSCNLLMLLCGAVLAGMAIFLGTADPEAGNIPYIFLALGILLCADGAAGLLLSRSWYFRVDSSGITSRYPLFGKLDCQIEDIAFVSARINTLSILLTDGTRHIIMGVQNPWPLCSAIRSQHFAPETESPDSIRQTLAQTRANRRKIVLLVIFGSAGMIAVPLLAALLTGCRDMDVFGKTDWGIFTGMACLEVVIAILTLRAANRGGKLLLSAEYLDDRLRIAVILSQPLPTNHAIAVYIGGDHTGRAVVCGFPQSESVYYCVQEFGEDFRLETTYTSKVYANTGALPVDRFSDLLDITSYVFTHF